MIIDNCTRKWLALPLFETGRRVKSTEIVPILKSVLPKELQWLISDNGQQFISQNFEKMCQERDFIHIRITPHRPVTNGIAERAVRTFKEMLFARHWHNVQELQAITEGILEEYNDRPHQGKELKGLSPNEYERRLLSLNV
ncbi:MAG: integrase core domain-containing protein [Candidatus Cloacimonadia bacterium]